MRRRDLRSRALPVLLLTGAGVLALPASALAHGIVGRTDLPIPRWLFAWAAAVVLIVSFVALASLWAAPLLEVATGRSALRVPALVRPACGAIGVAFFALVVYAGLAGEQVLPPANLAPSFIFVIFWVGLAFASLPLGDVFRAFNPWLAIALALRWLLRRLPGERRAALAYPAWLGRWPALPGILGFAWLELIYVEHDNPRILGTLALCYAALQLAGMAVFGIELWEERADGFSVYFNLFSRISPLRWHRDRVEARLPLSGLVRLEAWPGTIPLLCAMIGSTSFDGLQQTVLWMNTLEPELQSVFESSGLGVLPSVELAGSAGLLGMTLLVGAVYRLGILGVRTVDRRRSSAELAGRFSHTLVPIALAYVMAHYWSLLVYQVQAVWFLMSDPLGNGSNIFGTAGGQVNYNVISPNSIWYVQIAVLLAGHAAALALAHDRALVLYSEPRDAVRSQYWMLVVMVFFTGLGLWLLSHQGS